MARKRATSRASAAASRNALLEGPEPLDSDTAAVRATGRIQRLYFDAAGCYIRLAPAPVPSPRDGYFQLQKSHANYSALVSLLLLAVSQGYAVTLRTSGDIVPTEHAVVIYAVIDF
jgi:hypothetical protein